MQFIKCDALKPGMRLAKPIFNKNGTLLYERDTKISASSISGIQHFGLPGLYILEPAEPVPPLSDEDVEFERFQTVTTFQLQDDFASIRKEKAPAHLAQTIGMIIQKYGNLDHKFNFIQNLRSTDDFTYKHSINVAILCAMLGHTLNINKQHMDALIYSGLLHDIGLDPEAEKGLNQKKPAAKEPEKELSIDSENEDERKALYSERYNKRLQGYYLLRSDVNPFELPNASLAIIHQYCQVLYHPDLVEMPRLASAWNFDTKILQVANTFDMLTAMQLNHEPMSFLSAMRYLKKHDKYYDPVVVSALTECLHILPAGTCVDLNTNEKALVILENPSDFDAPVIIKFDGMKILDLGNPSIAKKYSIKDNMRTMDNRIQIDEKTLAYFNGDEALSKTTSRIQTKLAKSHEQDKESLLADKEKELAEERKRAMAAAKESAKTLI